jgi:hypothetical protein
MSQVSSNTVTEDPGSPEGCSQPSSPPLCGGVMTIVQEEGTPSTAVLAAAVPLLALPGPAIADEVGAVTGGTGQDLEHPDATRWQ